MKNSVMILGVLLLALTACKNNHGPNANTAQNAAPSVSGVETVYACPMHPDITGKKGDKCSKCGMALAEVKSTAAPAATSTATTANVPTGSTVSIKPLVDSYLQMKNAFTADNTRDAAAAGKVLEAAFKGFDKSALTDEQKKTYGEIEDEAREHAEHIGANGGKIEHQREHFAMLSKDMYDLVKTFGVANQPLYQDFCPMYDKGKGAIWLSETKEIKNPYLGKKMPTCGSVKEEIK